ncbi:hypothetical protein [Myroides odoratimimus]|uniref:hypothetical protein n=1 Tax=Myroides odoratimimus TaxID=76832 RepID=UPI0004681865|nr:hypothetical protein [Myroides odoratimimus]
MIIKKTLKIIILLFSLTISYGQKIEHDSLINNIKKDVTLFFIQNGILEKEVVKHSLNYISIIEIKEGKILGYNTNGIYSLGVYQSHSPKHIMIKENNNYKIIDLNQIDIALKETIDYLIRNKYSRNEFLLYLKNIIQKYEDNTSQNYTSKNKKIIQK